MVPRFPQHGNTQHKLYCSRLCVCVLRLNRQSVVFVAFRCSQRTDGVERISLHTLEIRTNTTKWRGITLYDSRSSEKKYEVCVHMYYDCSSVPSVRALWSSSKHNSRRRLPVACIRFSRWLPFVVARPFFILLMFTANKIQLNSKRCCV